MAELWNNCDLQCVLRACRVFGEEHLRDLLSLPFRLDAASEEAIRAREHAMGRSLPEPIRNLYRMLGGISRDLLPHLELRGSVFLWPLTEIEWLDHRTSSELISYRDSHATWYQSEYLVFGQGVYGDMVAYRVDETKERDGMIVVFDHEGSGPENDLKQPQNVVVLGTSLADWLSRWLYFGCEEYAYVSGAIDDLPVAEQERFWRDHLRLNPGLSPH